MGWEREEMVFDGRRLTDSNHYNYSYPNIQIFQIRDGKLKNQSEIRGLNKDPNNTATQKIDKSPLRETPPLAAEETNQENKEKQQELEEKRNNYGKLSLAFIALLIGSLLSPLSSFSLVFSLMLFSSTKKIEESNRLMGQLIGAEASKRVRERLKEFLGDDIVKLYSAEEEPRLKFGKKSLDYLLTLQSGISFAISVSYVVPPADEKLRSRVYLDPEKKLLSYRKGRASKRYFQYDPLQTITEVTSQLYQYNLLSPGHSPIMIAVMADPIVVTTQRTPAFRKELYGRTYLCVNDIYVVEESRLINLIRSIIISRKRLQNDEKA